ncbi:MAG: hypothetical protein IJH71_04180 [Eubacterium sp.]|nr:hypothetical protein [Eubacterium sp.]
MKKGYLFITMLLLSCLFLAACRGGVRPDTTAESETVQEEESTEEAISAKSKTASDNGDPFSMAIDACLKYADVQIEDTEDLKITEVDKEIYRVTFRAGGKDYDLLYNNSSGKVTEN